ncbi:hypothetical protein DASB73_005170 [Starmerella bacillaris]|uniref:Kinetochore protein Nuf2 N-terminal domain-containing protein n=1 Tax=Starmerella bacillaris TaxID=1247836 RepID=A0AAV5RDJ1_STABA|nr:hypothetical protein DASB73_005170 [Starmerella bacillaris]
MSSLAEIFEESHPNLVPYILITSHPPERAIVATVWRAIVDVINGKLASNQILNVIKADNDPNLLNMDYLIEFKVVSSLALLLGADNFDLQDYNNPTFERYQYLLSIFNDYVRFRDGLRHSYQPELDKVVGKNNINSDAKYAKRSPNNNPKLIPKKNIGDEKRPRTKAEEHIELDTMIKSLTGRRIDLESNIIPALKSEINALRQEVQKIEEISILAKTFCGNGSKILEGVNNFQRELNNKKLKSKESVDRSAELDGLLGQFRIFQESSFSLLQVNQRLIFLQDGIRACENLKSELDIKITDLREKINSNEEECSKLKIELEKARNETKRLQQDLKQLETWKHNINQEIVEDTEVVSNNTIKFNSHDSDITELSKARDSLQRDIEEQSKWLDDMDRLEVMIGNLEIELKAIYAWARNS